MRASIAQSPARPGYGRRCVDAIALTNITLAGPYQVALPFLVDQRFSDVPVLGLLFAASVGYILGGIWLSR